MTTSFKKRTSFIPSYHANAVLQLIVASGVGYVAFLFTAVCFQAFGHYRFEEAIRTIRPYIALPGRDGFGSAPWTLLTYGWTHYGFWEWVSNMIWLYCFGGVVQMLVGHREIIPLFVYSLIAGGIFYLAGQWLPVSPVGPGVYVLGAQAGVTGLAVAALSLSPRYRLYMSPTFSIPLPVLAGIFAALMLLRTALEAPALLMLAGGGLMGFVYVRLLRAGYKPGSWVYDVSGSLDRMFSPGARKVAGNRRRDQVMKDLQDPARVSQRRIDELLDKIGQHGYDSLTSAEKEILRRAGGENS